MSGWEGCREGTEVGGFSILQSVQHSYLVAPENLSFNP